MYIHTHNLAHHSQTAGEKKDLKICEGSQEKNGVLYYRDQRMNHSLHLKSHNGGKKTLNGIFKTPKEKNNC